MLKFKNLIKLKVKFIFLLIVLSLVYDAGLCQDIPLRNDAYYILQKRKKEANLLIEEGKKLIKAGTNKKSPDLVKKGNIKLEIGKNQLKILEEKSKRVTEENKQNAF